MSLLLVCAALLAWGVYPAKQNQRQVNLPARDAGGGVQKSFTASQLQITWPERLLVGGTGQVVARLEPITGTPLAATPAGQPGRTTQVEARLEVTGLLVAPDGVIQQSNQIAAPLEFRWQIRPIQPGVFPVTVWLHLLDSSSPAGDDSTRRLLTVQPLEFHAASLFGLNAYQSQVIGIIGVILGAALCFDIFIRKKQICLS